MTKSLCDNCERSRVSREYYPCQVRKVERVSIRCEAESRGQQYTYIPKPEIKTEKEIPKTKMPSKKEIRQQQKEDREKRQIERNLEEACGMFGWEENDNIDRALHAKNFIRACISRKVDPSNSEYNFKHIISMIENNSILKKREESCYGNWSAENVYDSINIYIGLMKEGKLSGFEGYNTLFYAEEIAKRIKTFIPAF